MSYRQWLWIAVTSLYFATHSLAARPAQPQTFQGERPKWHANWITHPTAPLREPVVLHFRREFRLEKKPDRFVVMVSADNRFKLYVNGQRVGEGPARGDYAHWRYETFDLAPCLKEGGNFITATVWQFGVFAPLAQISDRLAFLLEGETDAESLVNTDAKWLVEQDKGHGVKRPLSDDLWQYQAAGPGEWVDFHQHDSSWNAPSRDGGEWVQAGLAMRESVFQQENVPLPASTGNAQRLLLYRDPLPQMEYKKIESPRIARATGVATDSPAGTLAVIPPATKANLLLDQDVVVSGYPEIVVSGGEGARVQVVYAESLYDKGQKRANRAEVADRVVLGLTDQFLPDGGASRIFTPLWWRTWRFLELQIQTGNEALRVEAVHAFSTAYPFEDRAKFTTNDPELARIREICWRTARLDAHETYMDTAYWEQLQYFGDTRIQMLISYIVSGDDRLARQALRAANDSILPEGLTQSRYPSSLVQIIPPFSLIYVNSLHDFWMYRPDPKLVAELLPGTRSVLAWFSRHQRPDGFLERLPYWNFVDWVADGQEYPPLDHEGRSAVLTLHFIGALRDAAEIEEALGDKALAEKYRKQAQRAAENVFRQCWSEKFNLLADTPDQHAFSEQTNALGVLYDVVPAVRQATLVQRLFAERANKSPSDIKLTRASYYFQFYLSRALEHAGLGNMYVETLQPWREMLTKGLTTTPETPDPSRSDTHAWSAHPAYDFSTIIAGVRPASPGFATVRIAPSLGALTSVEAVTPHPNGSIRTSYRRKGEKVEAVIELPQGVNGILVWKSQTIQLHAGAQRLALD